ncbi:DUF4231 domain-containing protein [Streptomyces turgidiscabies]|uniref:DUF4231 domain-containing protein n=1 Tax=Streptomyces turgidiscabies TaxID=85558 RepID=A0ABU0S3R8_9ACTN|nr:DUF4231 domain-containing protein [Streptomyces turgidiscabies]MDQ0938072.1 hypothetical protein [Streptomyces turgidiscabies]
MTGNSANSRQDFWPWVRAALAFSPIDDRVLRDTDLPLTYRVNDYQAMVRQGISWREKRTYLLILLLAAAMVEVSRRTGSGVPAALAAVLYGLAITIGMRTFRWRAGASGETHRAVAETLKSMAWLYMVHGGPFHSRATDPDALFAERLEASLLKLKRVGLSDQNYTPTSFAAAQITPAMRTVRSKSFETRREIYLRDRLLEQSVWYRNSAARAHTAFVRWSVVTTILTLLALLAAVLQAVGLADSWSIAGLFSASIAAAVAWQELRQHGPRAYAFGLIVQELEMLRVVLANTVTEEGWADAVADAEQLVSPQYADLLMRVGA